MAEKEEADVVEIVPRFRETDLRVMPPAQFGLFVLTGVVFGAMLLFMAALLVLYWQTFPPAPEFIKGADMKAELAHYEMLNTAALERVKALFDLIVMRGLMPILTAVVGGYIGYQAARKE